MAGAWCWHSCCIVSSYWRCEQLPQVLGTLNRLIKLDPTMLSTWSLTHPFCALHMRHSSELSRWRSSTHRPNCLFVPCTLTVHARMQDQCHQPARTGCKVCVLCKCRVTSVLSVCCYTPCCHCVATRCAVTALCSHCVATSYCVTDFVVSGCGCGC